MPEGGAAEVGEVVQGFNRMADALARQREALDDHQGELEAQKSELEQALETLEERNAHIDLVRRFGDQMIAEGSSVETVAVAALRGMADAADCEVGAIYLRDENGGGVDAYLPVATRGVLPEDVEPIMWSRARARRAGGGRGDAGDRGSSVRRRWRSTASPGPIAWCTSSIFRFATARRPSVSSAWDVCRDELFSPTDLALLSDLAERAGSGCLQALATRRLSRTARDLGRSWRRSTRASTGSTPPGGSRWSTAPPWS